MFRQGHPTRAAQLSLSKVCQAVATVAESVQVFGTFFFMRLLYDKAIDDERSYKVVQDQMRHWGQMNRYKLQQKGTLYSASVVSRGRARFC